MCIKYILNILNIFHILLIRRLTKFSTLLDNVHVYLAYTFLYAGQLSIYVRCTFIKGEIQNFKSKNTHLLSGHSRR